MDSRVRFMQFTEPTVTAFILYVCIILFYFVLQYFILVPFFFIWSVMNSVAWYNQSTQALPFTTIVLLLLIWLIGKSAVSVSRSPTDLLQKK